MLKKRIIFVLFFKDGYFHLSRNFRLQQVGDATWLMERFRFLDIGQYVDELIILNLSRSEGNVSNNSDFKCALRTLMSDMFVPLTIGGGVRSLSDASYLYEIGADKIALNWALYNNQSLVQKLVERYGSQSVVASVDVRRGHKSGTWNVFCQNGSREVGPLNETYDSVQRLNVGELLLTSIDQDGTSEGLDLALYDTASQLPIPVIACGGVGRPEHVIEAMNCSAVSAVATGNLFNFIGSGFEQLRSIVANERVDVRRPLKSMGI